MATKNDVTGDSIRSKLGNQKAYSANWDKIFGKKKKVTKKKSEKMSLNLSV
jgi:hypothetical protein